MPANETTPPLFRCAPIAMLRMSALPHDRVPAPPPGLDLDDRSQLGDAIGYIRSLCSDPNFCEAVALASPTLWAATERLLGAPAGSPAPSWKKVRRAALALTKYRLRMSMRPTPFGLMAGVTTVSFGEPRLARIGPGRRSRTRPDLSWLGEVVSELEADPRVLAALKIMSSPGIIRRGQTLIRETYSAGSLRGARAGLDHAETARPAHPLDEVALAAARHPVSLDSLMQAISSESADGSPGLAPGEVIRSLIADGFLVTDLRPPVDEPDPLRHVIRRLCGLPGLPAVAGLTQIQQLLDRFDNEPPGTRLAMARSLQERMHALNPAEPALHTDLVIDADLQLPRDVAAEAEKASDALWRLTAAYPGRPGLQAYHQRFLGAYGTGRLIPLADLLSPEIGLGMPEPRDEPLDAPARPPVTSADRTRWRELARLVFSAARQHQREIVLDESMIVRLSRNVADPARMPPSAEMYAELVAKSTEAMRGGDFLLVVTLLPRQLAGATFGRFAHMLPDAHAQVRQLFRGTPTHNPDAERVGLAYWPHPRKMANAVLVPHWFDRHVTAGAAHPSDPAAQIRPDDLAVGADRERLYVIDTRTGREVVPTQGHVINVRLSAPDTARFLYYLEGQGTALWRLWDWGPAAYAEYQPRLRYGRSILHPATWRLGPEIAAAARQPSAAAWQAAVEGWRTRLDPPRRVLLRMTDQRIAIDLDEPVHLSVLRQEAARAGRLTLTELPGGEDYQDNWLASPAGPYRAEIVFPLQRRAETVPARRRGGRPARMRRPGEGRYGPGSEWLYAKLYASTQRHEEILGGHLHRALPGLLEAAGADRWFYIRYADPEPHIRLRFHGPRDRLWTELLGMLQSWTDGLRRDRIASHLVIDTYDQELERYAGPQAIAAAETAFAADSTLALGLLHLAEDGGSGPGLLDLGMLSAADLLDTLTPASAPPGTSQPERLLAAPGWPAVTELCEQRRPAVAGYRDTYTNLARKGESWTRPDIIPASLLHMHCNRLFGIDRSRERQVYAALRGALRVPQSSA